MNIQAKRVATLRHGIGITMTKAKPGRVRATADHSNGRKTGDQLLMKCIRGTPYNSFRPSGRVGSQRLAGAQRLQHSEKITLKLNQKETGSHTIDISLGGAIVTAMLDTGASDNFISSSVFSKLSKRAVIKSRHIDEVATLANGSGYKLKRKALLRWKVGHIQYK